MRALQRVSSLLMAKKFRDLSEREILAVAISLEEEGARIYADYADGLRDSYPNTANIFDEMRAEEIEHRNSLMDSYRSRFGEHIPLIRRHDVKGFIQRRPLWLSRPLQISEVRTSRSRSWSWKPVASTTGPSLR